MLVGIRTRDFCTTNHETAPTVMLTDVPLEIGNETLKQSPNCAPSVSIGCCLANPLHQIFSFSFSPPIDRSQQCQTIVLIESCISHLRSISYVFWKFVLSLNCIAAESWFTTLCFTVTKSFTNKFFCYDLRHLISVCCWDIPGN